MTDHDDSQDDVADAPHSIDDASDDVDDGDDASDAVGDTTADVGDTPADVDDVSDDVDDDRSIIRAGRNFEATYRLDASEAGAFLIALGRQLRDDDELTLSTDEWELPFAFGEPAELEIDFEGMDDPELEIELELPGRTDETAPEVS